MSAGWGNWIRWEQGPMPVPANEIVQVAFGPDDILAPMPAGDIDWDFPGDPVVKYRRRESEAFRKLQGIAAAPKGENVDTWDD